MAVFHPRARFDSYVENALPPVSRARIAAHLAQCGECRREVAQRERILEFSSSVQNADPARPVTAHPPAAFREGRTVSSGSADRPVLEARDGVPGWKVVVGMGALGLAAAVVLSAAWIAGDPESVAETGAGGDDRLWPAAASPSAASPLADGDAARATETESAPAARGTGDGPQADTGASEPAELSPAGVRESSGFTPTDGAGPEADTLEHAGVSLAGAVALTPDMVTDLRQHGWNVPSLNGFGLHHDATGWALAGDTAEVVMSLQGDGTSLVLHECRSLSEDAGVPGCPVDESLAGPGGTEGDLAAAGETHTLPVGVEMSVLDHGDGTWSATASTAQAAYAVESDLPMERADRVMSLVVISERSRVQSGLAPESPADRLARGFEILLPWVAEPGYERR